MNFILFLINLLLTSIFIFYIYFKYKFSYWKSKSVHYITPKIPFGNVTFKTHFTMFSCDAYKMKKNHNLFVGGYIFSQPVAIITDLDLIKNITRTDFEYFSDRGLYYNERDDPLSANLLNLEAEKWKSLRVKLTPTFTSSKMKFMLPTIVKVGNEFQKTLENLIPAESIDIEIKDLISRFTTDIIGTCAFGIECNSLNDPEAEFLKMGKKAFFDGKLDILIRLFETQFPNLSRLLRLKWIGSDVSKFFTSVVEENVKYREKNNIRRNDFMDILIELKNGKFENDSVGKLTMNEIAAQAFVFFLAGFETSATTMSYTIYELALNPEIQIKARKEIETVMQKHNQNLTYEAITEMVYIDQIISETLRKYPPIPSLLRKAKKHYKVPNTNHTIEKGISVLLPVYAIHHDPDIYPDPEKFDPDRFSPDNTKLRHPLSFLSFGDGPRNCIGARFGRMQARIGLVSLLRNFHFDKCEKTEIPITFDYRNPILSSKNGIWIKIKKNV